MKLEMAMNMNNIIYILLAVTLAACANPYEEEAPADFFTQTPHVLPKHLELEGMYGSFITPNTFTPTGSVNRTFFITFEYGYLEKDEWASFDYFKIFDRKGNLIRNLDDFEWDGTNEDGEYVFGEFSFEASLILPEGQQVKGIGYVLSIGDCVDSKYDPKYMIFPDGMHPRLGHVFPTQAEIVFCD